MQGRVEGTMIGKEQEGWMNERVVEDGRSAKTTTKKSAKCREINSFGNIRNF